MTVLAGSGRRAEAPPVRQPKRRRAARLGSRAAYAYVAPFFVVFAAFRLYPLLSASAVLAMLTFLAAWNDFFWPLIALTSRNPTVQIGLAGLGSGYIPQQAVIMAGTLLCTFPVLIVFALLGRQIVGGIMQGAVKG